MVIPWNELPPVAVLSVRVPSVVGFVDHVGLVTNYIGADGFRMVIHASKQHGDVRETTATDFARGTTVTVVETLKSALPPELVLARARALIGRRWDAVSANCEHFVRYALGLEVESPQLRQKVTKFVVGATIVAAFAATNSPSERALIAQIARQLSA